MPIEKEDRKKNRLEFFSLPLDMQAIADKMQSLPLCKENELLFCNLSAPAIASWKALVEKSNESNNMHPHGHSGSKDMRVAWRVEEIASLFGRGIANLPCNARKNTWPWTASSECGL